MTQLFKMAFRDLGRNNAARMLSALAVCRWDVAAAFDGVRGGRRNARRDREHHPTAKRTPANPRLQTYDENKIKPEMGGPDRQPAQV